MSNAACTISRHDKTVVQIERRCTVAGETSSKATTRVFITDLTAKWRTKGFVIKVHRVVGGSKRKRF
jgi:hypothetical protein